MNITTNKILRTRILIAGMIGVVTFIVYIPALRNEFINWDDNQYVYLNPFIRFLDIRLLKEAFWGFYAFNWHPLTWLSHALDYAVWGLNPLGHHLTNNILHALNTAMVVLLVMHLVEVLGKSRADNGLSQTLIDRKTVITGAAVGLLFGLHPMHVESVAWVAERKDLLCAFFFLLSLLTYSRYAGSISEPGRPVLKRQYLLTLGFFILALLSKPMAVTLPFVLLMLDWYPFERIRSLKTFREVFIEKLPFFALSLISSILTILAQKAGGAMAMLEAVPWSTRLLVGAHSLIAYMGKMIAPFNLVPFYPYPGDVSFATLEYIVPLVLLAGITVTCLSVMGKQRFWITAWGYYVITLLPVIGIIQIGQQAMADRYTYLPSLGPFLIIGVLVAGAYEKVTALTRWRMLLHTAALCIALAMLTSLSFATIRQIGIWKDMTIFWSYVIEKEPERVYWAYNNLGHAYLSKGQYDMAIEQLQIALRLKSDWAEPHFNLGHAYLSKGQYDMAIEQLQIALRLKPDWVEPYYDLGIAYGYKGQYDMAVEQLQIALRLKPDWAEPHFNLGVMYLNTGSTDKARAEFELVLKLNPDDDEARQALDYIISRQR